MFRGFWKHTKSPIVGYCDRTLDVLAIVDSYKIPRPTTQYCSVCGTKLRSIIFGARRHYFGTHDPATGKSWFIIDAKYVCPQNTKHTVNEFSASGHAVYWSNWAGNRFQRWCWNTPFELTEMTIPRQRQPMTFEPL